MHQLVSVQWLSRPRERPPHITHASFPCTQSFTERTHAPSHIPRYITTHRIFLPLLVPSPDGGDLRSWNAMSSLGYRFNMRVARY